MAVHGAKVWFHDPDPSLHYESPDGSQVGQLYGVAYLHELKDKRTGILKYKVFERDPQDVYCDTLWVKNSAGRVVACPRTGDSQDIVNYMNEGGASSPYFWPSAAEIATAKKEMQIRSENGKRLMAATAQKRKESAVIREMLSGSVTQREYESITGNEEITDNDR